MKEISQSLHETEASVVPVEAVFYQEKATALLNINSKIPGLELERKEAEKLGLSEKEEFHFTIIGNETGEEILKFLGDVGEKEKNVLLKKMLELINSTKWRAVLKNDFYYVEKEYNDPDPANPELTIPEKRRSIIQMAEVDGLDEFYQQLNLLLKKQFKTPLPHITLFTASTREDKRLKGIGIYFKSQFEELNPRKM